MPINIEQAKDFIKKMYLKLLDEGPERVPAILLQGPPGLGKSQSIKQCVVELNKMLAPRGIHLNFIDVRLSQFDPTDIKGLPQFAKKKIDHEVEDVVKWILPEVWPRSGYGILFLDEINLAPPAVQAACLVPGTYVATKEFHKPIEEIKEGDYVLSHDGQLHRVEKVWTRPWNGTILRVKCRHCLPFEITPDHIVMTRRIEYITSKREWKFGPIEWKRIGELKKGDWLGIPIPKGIYDVKELDLSPYYEHTKPKYMDLKLKLDYDIAEFMGLFVAEGHIDDGGEMYIDLGSHERELIERAKKLIRKLFTDEIVEEPSRSRNGVRLRFYVGAVIKRAFRDWFYDGSGSYRAKNKRIPSFILYHKDLEILRRFLKGYWLGDGSVWRKKIIENYGRIQMGTSSKILARQLQLAFARLGLAVSIHETIEEGEVRIRQIRDRTFMTEGPHYHIYSRHDKIFEIMDEPVPIDKKRPTEHFKIADGMIWVKIDKIEEIPYKGIVYDLTVEQAHTFTAENVAVHNSYQLILDRKIGEYEVPRGWMIIGAQNPPEQAMIAYPLPPPLRNRFVILDIAVDYEVWRRWAELAGIHPDVIAFLDPEYRRESYLLRFDMEKPFPSPRTWEFVSEILEAADKYGIPEVEVREAVIGAVGPVVGEEFIAWRSLVRSIRDVPLLIVTGKKPDPLKYIYGRVGAKEEEVEVEGKKLPRLDLLWFALDASLRMVDYVKTIPERLAKGERVRPELARISFEEALKNYCDYLLYLYDLNIPEVPRDVVVAFMYRTYKKYKEIVERVSPRMIKIITQWLISGKIKGASRKEVEEAKREAEKLITRT